MQLLIQELPYSLLEKVTYILKVKFCILEPYKNFLNDAAINSSCFLAKGNYYCECSTNTSKIAYPIISFKLNTNEDTINYNLDVTWKEYLIPV